MIIKDGKMYDIEPNCELCIHSRMGKCFGSKYGVHISYQSKPCDKFAMVNEGKVIDYYKEKYLKCHDTGQKIYIIGSLSQEKQIKRIADELNSANVRYVQPEPDKTFIECVSTCFDNIEWADCIYVVSKPDGTIGQGVTYELEYAKRLNKEIHYITEV